MPAEEVAKLRDISPKAMRQRVVAKAERDFRNAFIDGGGAELAPVIGHGMTQNREHSAPITNPHGFSVEWLRLGAGQSVSPFTLSEKMVLILRKGSMRLLLNDGGTVVVDLQEWETYSVPAGVVRAIETIGDGTAEALVVVSGDQRKFPQFSDQVLQTAKSQGLSLDAGGYIATASLLPHYHRGS
jgi:hypothetical protein